MMSAVEETLGDSVFGLATEDELDSLFRAGEVVELAAGSTLTTAGQRAVHVLFLRSGLVTTTWPVSPHRNLLRGIVGGPGILDVSALFGGALHTYTSVTLTDVVVLAVAPERLVAWLSDHPRSAIELVRQGAAAERLFLQRLQQQHLLLQVRLDDLLRSYVLAYRHAGHEGEVELPLTNELVASHLGVVGRSVSASLVKLQRNGVMRRTQRGMKIVRPEQVGTNATLFLAPGWVAQCAPIVSTSRRGVLLVEDGGTISHEIGAELRIGRGPECRVRLEDDEVAVRHCRVFRATTSDRYWIEDLKGTGAVTLNGRSITRAVLSDGDEIRIGRHRVRFRESLPDSPS